MKWINGRSERLGSRMAWLDLSAIHRQLEVFSLPIPEFIPVIQLGGNDVQHDFVLIGAKGVAVGSECFRQWAEEQSCGGDTEFEHCTLACRVKRRRSIVCIDHRLQPGVLMSKCEQVDQSIGGQGVAVRGFERSSSIRW